jgi:hypothetical protein
MKKLKKRYMKNNKVAHADYTTAKLLKNGGSSLVDAPHEFMALIGLVFFSELLPENWTQGVLRPEFNKYNEIDCRNYRDICISIV